MSDFCLLPDFYFLRLCTVLFQRKVMSRHIVPAIPECSVFSERRVSGVINCFPSFHYLILPPPCFFQYKPVLQTLLFFSTFSYSDLIGKLILLIWYKTLILVCAVL